ncbi:MAG: acyltransferase [Bacteroidales bacterium]|nr:acyltransferase [Bacteroidales bacterium]
MGIKYRSDIDGLRAIAILSVIVFHLKSTWLTGGFLGVDIFFVISGYLITRIIVTDLETNNFSFAKFYLRRIRRILPVFFVVLITVLIFGALILIPEDFFNLTKSAQYALVFFANVFFSNEGGYFDLSVEQKPLHHIWSLSVEEQFYLIWPLLLFLIYILIKKQILKKSIVFFLVLVLLALSEYYLKINVHKAYYLLPARAVELVIGASVNLIPKLKDDTKLSILVLCQCTLFAILCFCLYSYDSSTPFPGLMVTLPTISTAGLIYLGDNAKKSLSSIFSYTPLVWIGKLSYSLYLWHWPILAYMRYVYGDKLLPHTWLAVAFLSTFFFSTLSYHFIERPFRVKQWRFHKAFILIYVIPVLIICAFCYCVKNSFLITKYYRSPELTSYGEDWCHGKFVGDCIRGDKSKKPKILMIGDSHAAHYNAFIDFVGCYEGWSAVVVSGSSCSPVFDYNEKALPEWAQQPCVNLKNYIDNHWKDFDIIFIASLWYYQLGLVELDNTHDPLYFEKLTHTVERFVQNGKKVYLFSDIPQLQNNPSRLEKFRILRLNRFVKPQSDNYLIANNKIKSLTLKFPNVYWVNTCDCIISSVSSSGKSIYKDNHHLNLYGSYWLGEQFIQKQHIISPQDREKFGLK